MGTPEGPVAVIRNGHPPPLGGGVAPGRTVRKLRALRRKEVWSLEGGRAGGVEEDTGQGRGQEPEGSEQDRASPRGIRGLRAGGEGLWAISGGAGGLGSLEDTGEASGGARMSWHLALVGEPP